MRTVRLFSRFILGVLFIFSGFVKALDPLGSAYKFSDYFHAFSLGFLEGLSVPLGIFLAGFEFVLGMVLLAGYQKKITYWVLLVFMSFFTVLTFILALTNPVTDCGCFGDAIIMTNWQTFFKNLVFMVFVLVLFASRSAVRNVHSDLIERLLITGFFALIFVFSGYSLRHLPVIDFRPYDIGTFIPEEMEIPEDAPSDEYSTLLYYRNKQTGVTEEFTLENYPTDTASYEFVTSESKLIKKGYEPPIHDFGILDPDGQDVTDLLLSHHGYVLFMTSPDLSKANSVALEKSNAWSKLTLLSEDFLFIPVTASAGSDVDEIRNELSLEYSFYAGDETMLKTMVRSNPGYLMIKNGTIVSKWAHRDFPDLEDWNKDWPGQIAEYEDSMLPELTALIAEGAMDPIQWNIVDFDQTANKIVSLSHLDRTERLVWTLYALIVILLLVLLRFIPEKKTH